MKQNNQKKWLYVTLLSLIVIFHAINNFVWLKMDNIPTGCDVCNHLTKALDYFTQINMILFSPLPLLGKFKGFLWLLSHCSENWPPLIYVLTTCLNISGDFSTFWSRFTNIFYFLILILSTYLIGAKCFNRKAGLLAAFLISFYPVMYGLSRQFGLDFPLTAMTALAVYALLETENFKNTYRAFLFGVIFGLGILVKMQIVFFLVGPICYVFWKGVIAPWFFDRETPRNYQSGPNFIFSLCIAGAISSVWWFGRISLLSKDFLGHLLALYPISSIEKAIKIPSVLGRQLISPFSFKGLSFYYFQSIAHITPFFFALFICSIFSFWKIKRANKLIIVFWISTPYLIFTLISCKWARYYFPALPGIAILTAGGILGFKEKLRKQISIFSIIGIGLLQFFKFSYGFPFIPNSKLQLNYPVKVVRKYRVPKKSNLPECISNFALEILKRDLPKYRALKIAVLGDWQEEIVYFLKLHFPYALIWNSWDNAQYLKAKNPDFFIICLNPEGFKTYPDEIDTDCQVVQKKVIENDTISRRLELYLLHRKKRDG